MATGITVDELVVLINAETKDFRRQVVAINDQLDGISKQSGKMSKTSTLAFGAIAGAAQSLVTKGIDLITSSVGDAVARFDTIQNFPRVMENFGIKSADAADAMKTLVAGVKGLPTPLNSVVTLAEGFVPMTKNIGKAATLATALAHAVAAGNQPMNIQANAMEQFSQALAKGKPELEDWKALQVAMPAQLTQIAEKLGLGSGALKQYGTDSQGLYAAMQDGKISMSDFTTALVDLDKKGNGVLPSFEQQAHNAAGGVGASFTVMKQGIENGIGDILKVLGQGNISSVIASFGTAFKSAFDDLAAVITFIKNNSTVFGVLAAAIGGATAALVVYNTVLKLSAIYMATVTTVSTYLTLVASLQAQGLGVLRAAWLALNITMAANPIGIVIVAVAALAAGIIYFATQTEIGRKVFQTAMSWIKSSAVAVWNWVKSNWPLLLGILTGPIGLAAAYILTHLNTVKASFSGALNYVRSIWSSIGSWFSGRVSDIVNAFTSLPSRVGSVFNGVVSRIRSIDWREIGIDIIRGIGSGIASMGGWLADQAKAAVGGAKDKLKSFLGIHSPSRVFRDEVGKNIGLGVSEGIVDSSKLAVKSVHNMSNDLINAVNGGATGSIGINGSLTSGKAIPIVLQLENGDILGRYVIDSINNRAFMTNSPVIDF